MTGKELFDALVGEADNPKRQYAHNQLLTYGCVLRLTTPLPSMTTNDRLFSRVNGYNVHIRPGKESPLLQISLAHSMAAKNSAGCWVHHGIVVSTDSGKEWSVLAEGFNRDYCGMIIDIPEPATQSY